MIYTIKRKSKHLNLKRIQLFLTWFEIPIKSIPIYLKWLIVMIGYNKLALRYLILIYLCALLYESLRYPGLFWNNNQNMYNRSISFEVLFWKPVNDAILL